MPVMSKTLGHGGEGSSSQSGKANLRDVLKGLVDDTKTLADNFNTLLADYDGHDHVASATAQPACGASAVTPTTTYEA